MALNPISFTEQVVSDFLRYQLTTYPLADTSLHAQMRALLRLEETRSSPLRKGPFVSLSKLFEDGDSIAELVRRGVLHRGMEKIALYPRVRKHQQLAIEAILRGETTLVATGTGSGKTESFLYPIISRCLELQEANAPPGIVAVLIYPMNALAEDQLDRMRSLLAGSGVPFGMYVRKTPDEEAGVRGERMPPGSSRADYAGRLAQIREQGLGITLRPHEERASRAAMRKDGGQPRILLTNVKQLELLLTRGKDVGLFANAPLELLVFDEAHTFRGAQGAETACLIRRLRTFCGKTADEVTCVATSATIADRRDPDASRKFASRFFGVPRERVTVVGEAYQPLVWNERRGVPAGPPSDPVGLLAKVLMAVDDDDENVADAISSCLVELGGARLPKRKWQDALASQLASNTLVHELATHLERPRALSEVSEHLTRSIGRTVSEHEILCWLALAVACGRGDGDPFLRPVVHSFIRGVGGAVVTFSDAGQMARLWLGGEDASHEIGDTWRRFPLLTCTTCGQHYYETSLRDFRLFAGRGGPEGGDRVGSARVWEHLAVELGGSRALVVDRLVVRPDEDDEEQEVDEEGEPVVAEPAMPSGHDFEHRRLCPLWLCAHCGGLHQDAAGACAACHAAGPLVAVQVVRSKEDLPGVLHSCVACQAPGRRPAGGRYREPARPVRATAVSDVHVLAQSMLHLSGDRPRLLVFADNRQDAAFQAGWMRDHARRFRLRALMAQQIPPTGASVGDVSQALDGLLERDRELSRALVPEVWRYAPQEDAGIKHREERLYFLRLQLLRELGTGVKQRLGLEPWGRVQVDYLGLDPNHDVIVRWAGRIGVDPAALTEGIAAILDHHRRVRVLHDASTRLFSKLWRSGDYEIQYGYIPVFSGGPRGVKRSRGATDLPTRVTQWVGTRPTQISNAVATWGLDDQDLDAFLHDLWDLLLSLRLLVPVTLEAFGRPMEGSAGTYQVDAGKLLIRPHRGRWRCEKCRRTTVRRGPTSVCMAWRCGGAVRWEESDPDDFDLHVLDSDYAMLRVAEHSAQVPTDVRERIENTFKGDGEQLNTLVCTPTLELGVDIGALDSVLMRNIPPSAASYWQRAGRAGRRHRMAVDVTYAQATSFDKAYFREPLKLLEGQVEPPRFNLKNELMIQKHVHATVLTSLHGIARRSTPGERQRIESVLGECFPPTLKPYLFTANDAVRPDVLDVSPLGALIREHRDGVLADVNRAFTSAWPAEDAVAVRREALERVVDGMAQSLATVLRRFKRRLDWAMGELRRLASQEQSVGALDPEDGAHRRRCERLVKRLKGMAQPTLAQAQGGPDDSNTMGALAREGFLPGYGLESGSIVGTAEPPRMTQGLDTFELPRAPTLALREYVPGNAIYANGFRFVPRRFQLTPDDTVRFRVDPENQIVQEVGVDSALAALGEKEIRAVPVCDAILPSQSQISDEEEFRFQMPVAVYAAERGFHRGGTAWEWAGLDLRFRRAVQLRMVNVGPRGEVAQGSIGYSVCLACGQSHSPYASARSQQEFAKKHSERCGHRVQPTGFFADVEVDTLGVHEMRDRASAFSFVEAIRMGAARVLDMEVEDLQIVGIRQPGEESIDILLYDPMPGGSGLLEHLAGRWEEVRQSALLIVRDCPSACERACIDCLHTYRNRFYHEHLDRHRAQAILSVSGGGLVEKHVIPEKLPKTATTRGKGQTHIENRFKRLLDAADLPAAIAQKRIDLAPNLYTTPDFFYEGEDADDPGICIYLDGMSGHLHGNPETAERDAFLRAKLRERGFEVIEVRSFELDDDNAVVGYIAKIARRLVGREKQRALRADTSWVQRASEPSARPAAGQVVRFRRVPREAPGSVPVYDLRIAAGAFSDGQSPEPLEHARIDAIQSTTGRFVARVVGDSMDRVVPKGAWCLWEHLAAPGVTAVAPGDLVVARRPNQHDPELGEFTFKAMVRRSEGWVLVPRSHQGHHEEIILGEGENEALPIARFVAVLEPDDVE